MVRSVCLKIVLQVLFKKKLSDSDDQTIELITESINTLWIQSKGNKAPSKADKGNLQTALKKIFREWNGKDSRENPLNLIIPSYETLWRVVLSGFLHVNFVKGASPTWKLALERFLANPTTAARKEEFDQDSEGLSVSVEILVKETLRLYPSVKRVYRVLNIENSPGPEEVRADIEACQRSHAVWGADTQRFVPSRWIDASPEAQESYLAFGGSPFVCPAQREFGPMMIGILVAAFAHHVSSEEWHLKLDEASSDAAQRAFEKALAGEEPLVSDRSTYDGIKMVRK